VAAEGWERVIPNSKMGIQCVRLVCLFSANWIGFWVRLNELSSKGSDYD